MDSIFLIASAYQKQESSMVAMFLLDQDQMRNLYKRPYIDDPCQILIHLANWLQRSDFLCINQLEARLIK